MRHRLNRTLLNAYRSIAAKVNRPWRRWLLLAAAAAAGALIGLLFVKKDVVPTEVLSVEITTDNQAHPLRLTLPDGKEGMFDILRIENLSDEPLSLLAFSSRPRIPGLPADQVMIAWAQWIATSRQGIIVEPKSTWVLNPNDLDRLPSFYGHTWISIFFSDTKPNLSGGLPATVLPPTFHGRLRLYYCLSQLSGDQIAITQMHANDVVRILQREIDISKRNSLALNPCDLNTANGLTVYELQ